MTVSCIITRVGHLLGTMISYPCLLPLMVLFSFPWAHVYLFDDWAKVHALRVVSYPIGEIWDVLFVRLRHVHRQVQSALWRSHVKNRFKLQFLSFTWRSGNFSIRKANRLDKPCKLLTLRTTKVMVVTSYSVSGAHMQISTTSWLRILSYRFGSVEPVPMKPPGMHRSQKTQWTVQNVRTNLQTVTDFRPVRKRAKRWHKMNGGSSAIWIVVLKNSLQISLKSSH